MDAIDKLLTPEIGRRMLITINRVREHRLVDLSAATRIAADMWADAALARGCTAQAADLIRSGVLRVGERAEARDRHAWCRVMPAYTEESFPPGDGGPGADSEIA